MGVTHLPVTALEGDINCSQDQSLTQMQWSVLVKDNSELLLYEFHVCYLVYCYTNTRPSMI